MERNLKALLFVSMLLFGVLSQDPSNKLNGPGNVVVSGLNN